MKKTGIAAMMLSTAIAVSGITVPVCAAPGQTAESAQMQEQPQTETEPAKSISDEDFAKLLDFEDLLRRTVGKLSGGQRRRIDIARALLHRPKILILDEPTNHLDVDAKDELKRALQEYRGSILLICHEPEFYQDIVNEVWDCSKWTTKIL